MENRDSRPFEEILYNNWKSIIVDAGSGGLVSVKAKNGQLVIMADENMPSVNYGRNNPEKGGLVVPIKENVGELSLKMQDQVNVVLCVAPDPRDIAKIAEDSETMLKRNGKMVIVVDLRSNLREEVNPAIESIKSRYQGSIYSVGIKEGNPHSITRYITGLDTHLQSRLILDRAKVIVIERKH